MKKTLLLLIVFFGWNDAIAQTHPPDCQLPFDHNHDNTICFGYAMARAFGKDKLWPDDNNVFAEPSEGVDLNYFVTNGDWYNSYDILYEIGSLTVDPGSIIVFYNQKQESGRMAQHASYVESVPPSGGSYQSDYLPAPLKRLAGDKMVTKDAAFYSTDIGDIVMHQVPNEGGDFEELTLAEVIDDWWNDGPVFRVFTPNITRNVQVMYKNDFNGTSAFGKMYFISDGTISGGSVPIPGDEVKLTITVPANGFEKYYFYGEKQKVEAFTPQEIAGNKYVFNNNWTAFGANLEGNKQTLIIYEDGDVTAHFGNSTTYTVQVSLFGDGETLDSYLKVGGVVTNVNGTTTAQYSSGNAILEAYPSLVLYGVVYQFSHWNTGSTSTTITASPNSSYAAYYNFHSVNPPSSFRIASLPGDPGIVLRWNEMLSPYITLLELWSKTKNTSYQLLETLPDSATRYVDSRYSISTVSQENNIGLEYQLKAKYVKPAVRTVWVQGGLFEWVSDDGVLPFERAKEEEMNAITLENALDAYPNPFNPSVVLRVQLKEAAHVSVVLYDITGRRVKQPMSGIFDAGAHDFTWNTQEDGYLPSGVYFAKMDLAPLSGGVPQQFVKKLMLSK